MNFNCPVCDSNLDKIVIETFYSITSMIEYQICFCPHCESSFSYPFKSADSTFYSYSVPKWRWEFSEFLKDLYQMNKKDISILEVGCNEGNLLERLAVDFSCYGIDFNKDAIEKARSKKLKCYLSDISNFKKEYPQLKFDVICFFHLLEHLDSPSQFLEDVYSMLNKDGKIFFSVPNPERLSLKAGREDGDYPPNHLIHFSLKGINILLKRKGFKIYKIMEQPKDINLYFFTSLKTYCFVRKIGLTWIYNINLSRFILIFLKAPFFILNFPLALFLFLKNYWRGGLSLYIVAMKNFYEDN